MKKNYLSFFIVLVVLIFGTMIFFLLQKVRDDAGYMISGNIEVTDSLVGFKIPGKLEKRVVEEGNKVQKGDLLAYLQKEDEEVALKKAINQLEYSQSVLDELLAGSRKEEIEGAYAKMRQAKHFYQELLNGSRPQEVEEAHASVASGKALLEKAQANLDLAAYDEKKFKALFQKGAISERDYEVYHTRYEDAFYLFNDVKSQLKGSQERLSLVLEGPREEEIRQAEDAYNEARASYELIKEGPRKEVIDQSKAQVKIAQDQLMQAKLNLEYTQVYAPFNGVVLTKLAEAGEYLFVGNPVVSVGDLDHVWLRAYINETDLGKITLNQRVKVTTDAYPGRVFSGRISFISDKAEFTPKTVQTFEERVKLMYRVKVDLDNPNWELKAGMPADAHIGA